MVRVVWCYTCNMNRQKPRQARARRYRSPLRAGQAQATRKQILDAVFALIRRGETELSFRALAREAGVSVPTVYRHFPDRDALIGELGAYAEIHGGHRGFPPTRRALPGYVGALFARFDDPNDVVAGPGRLTDSWDLSRALTVPARRDGFAALLDAAAPGLLAADRARLLDLCVVLASTATGEAFRGYLRRSGDETAAAVRLGLDAIFAHATTLARRRTP